VLLILALAAALVGSLLPFPVMPAAWAALESGARVQVHSKPWLSFQPGARDTRVGLILYPGARVDPRAYAPAARALAETGYLVVIPAMPLRLAVLAPDRAAEVMRAYPDVRKWAVGGHSLGGVMAARFARQHPGQVQGLVLWAAYPSASDALSASSIYVLSLAASQDGLAAPEEINASRWLLPSSTTWISIEGGNHAQFGWYGDQPGDGLATISRQTQQAVIVDATRALLDRLEGDSP
jgi:pimeloyl-ACP methyl ester carboxylesterase